MKYAIWAAVSTEAQATSDKVSLAEQEAKCRAAGAGKNWRETAGPYIVPGESRTKWINLRDAETAIPALHDMLDAAQRREFDCLVIYSYDRMRELLDPVSRSLAAYGVQMFSVSQPVDPVEPEQYDLYATDTSNAVQLVSSLTSRAEINALRRRWRIGIPKRVTLKGLHPSGRPPYGYRKPPGRELDPQAVLIQDPAIALIVVQIKDRYLAGQSVPQICAWLEARRVPAPNGRSRWWDYPVRYILKNSFYAGQVQHGGWRKVRDPRTGKARQVKGDPSKAVTAQGQHIPLWDEATRETILAEMQRRAHRYKGQKTYRLSHLLYCAVHNRILLVKHNHGAREDAQRIWYCPEVKEHWHLVLYDLDALDKISDRLVADLTRYRDQMTLPETPDHSAQFQTALTDLLARKERLVDALEAGTLDAAAYGERAQVLDQRIVQARADLTTSMKKAQGQTHRIDAHTQLVEALRKAPGFIKKADPQIVNQKLRSLIKKIAVAEDGNLEILYG